MTRAIGTSWLNQMLASGWTSPTISAYLLNSASLFNPTTSLTLANIPAPDRVSGPITLTSKTVSAGYFDAADIDFTLANGIVAAWVVLVQVGGSEAASPVVGSTDERADGSPILVTGNGGIVRFQVQALGLGRI